MGFETAAWMTQPLDSDAVGSGNDEIWALKSAVATVVNLEHDLVAGDAAKQGQHKLGSGIIYYGTSAPTTTPGGVALSVADKGRLWYDTTTLNLGATPPVYGILKVYDGSAWQLSVTATPLLAVTAQHIPTAQADAVAGAIWVS